MKYNYNYIYSLLKDFYPEELFHEDSDYTWNFIDSLKENSNIDVRTGASKFVCLMKNQSYVIKIPFNASIDPMTEEVYELKGGSGDQEEGLWDYCAREVFLYESSKIYNLDYAFPETQYLGNINGWPIYIQEKCIPLSQRKDLCKSGIDEIKKVKNIIKTSNDSLPFFNGDWLSTFYNIYNKNQTLKLLEFIQFNNISDLHIGNLGFSAIDLRPVLIDFSGFNC